MSLETLDEFKKRISTMSKQEIIEIRDELFKAMDVALKMRKAFGVEVYYYLLGKYIVCVDKTT